jgi:3-mercaptopyruvate sulfurtransferase SseA
MTMLSVLTKNLPASNYDGSWTKWGNRIGAPIETGE